MSVTLALVLDDETAAYLQARVGRPRRSRRCS